MKITGKKNQLSVEATYLEFQKIMTKMHQDACKPAFVCCEREIKQTQMIYKIIEKI